LGPNLLTFANYGGKTIIMSVGCQQQLSNRFGLHRDHKRRFTGLGEIYQTAFTKERPRRTA
jgi:hypothetical protein